jgi:hypothetical protein
MINLGAKERPRDDRDYKLGQIQAPIQIPETYLPDYSWIIPLRNYQGKLPTCSANADTHLRMAMDYDPLLPPPRYNPRFNWIEFKILDNYPLEDGTDMRTIFKANQNNGFCDYNLLDNDITLPLTTYSDPSVLNQTIVQNALPRRIQSYAFGETDYNSLAQHIYQNKAVLLLIKCDDGFWGTETPTFTTGKYGHFVCAIGYDPVKGIMIIDSADPNYAIKFIAPQYLSFVIESGTMVELPPTKETLMTKLIAYLQLLVGLLKKKLGGKIN